jgi:hypothetical protein
VLAGFDIGMRLKASLDGLLSIPNLLGDLPCAIAE